jgi:tRNA/tmRNA/rRNA uracil-C5-methylase (TrmA/RlmC/RlmD family)
LRVELEAAPGDDEANGLGYRTRVQLHVDQGGNVGPYRERSHEVVRVKDLPLAVEDIRELEMHKRNFQNAKKVEVATSNTGQIQYKVDNKLKGDERLIERTGGRTYRISGGGFWQVHKKAAEVLTEAVQSMVAAVGFDPAADNLDLYGGVGLFSGALAAKFGTGIKVTTVESFKQATDDAILNLSDISKAKAICSPVERYMNQKVSEMAKAKATLEDATVIIDPPRAGAGAKVVGQLIELAPKHLVYVACDPIALARDLKPLLAGGYELKQLRAFDLFPHTHHVEAIASLVRK